MDVSRAFHRVTGGIIVSSACMCLAVVMVANRVACSPWLLLQLPIPFERD